MDTWISNEYNVGSFFLPIKDLGKGSSPIAEVTMRGAEQLHPTYLEKGERVPPPNAQMTVADYLLYKFSLLGVTSFHTIPALQLCPLCSSAHQRRSVEPISWNTLSHAIWAAQMGAQCQGLSAVYCPEDLLHEVFNGVICCSQTLTPLVFVVRRSLKVETKELCSLPLSAKERGRKELRQLIHDLSATHLVLDDRRTAARLIDRALDTALELFQPVVLDLPDQVALSYIPSHIYRKTVFNFEDNDLVKSCWRTILSRLEQAHDPLCIFGPECEPFWKAPMLALANRYHASVIASEHLWGHFESNEPELMQGYTCMSYLDICEGEGFDSIFVFGVPADCHWLEALITQHDLSDDPNHELFAIHSNGVFFGDGRDTIPIPSLKEFFLHVPIIEDRHIRQKKTSFAPHLLEKETLSLISDPSSPLFSLNSPPLLSFLIEHHPIAKLYLPPPLADESWLAIAAGRWSTANPGQTIFIAGNAMTLSKIRLYSEQISIPNTTIFLLIDTISPKSVSQAPFDTILSDQNSIEAWKAEKKPACIWIQNNY